VLNRPVTRHRPTRCRLLGIWRDGQRAVRPSWSKGPFNDPESADLISGHAATAQAAAGGRSSPSDPNPVDCPASAFRHAPCLAARFFSACCGPLGRRLLHQPVACQAVLAQARRLPALACAASGAAPAGRPRTRLWLFNDNNPELDRGAGNLLSPSDASAGMGGTVRGALAHLNTRLRGPFRAVHHHVSTQVTENGSIPPLWLGVWAAPKRRQAGLRLRLSAARRPVPVDRSQPSGSPFCPAAAHPLTAPRPSRRAGSRVGRRAAPRTGRSPLLAPLSAAAGLGQLTPWVALPIFR